jgi:Ni,Fe-hydrogenase maturation factor
VQPNTDKLNAGMSSSFRGNSALTKREGCHTISIMKVYVFGNRELEEDAGALKAAEHLKDSVKGIEFAVVQLNEDLPFAGEKKIILMDAVEGIDKVTLIDENDLDKLVIAKSVSVHDFDLGFQLKYLKKLGKLQKVTIIGLPKGKRVNYLRIHSILRKLVEQETQGS